MSMRPGAALVVCLFGVALGAAGGCKPDPNAPPVFRTLDEYTGALTQVSELTTPAFKSLHDGVPLTEGQKKDLAQAKHLLDGCIAYRSDNYGPYILRGMALRALGRFDEALASFDQALALAPAEPTPDDTVAIAKLHDEMALTFVDQHDYAKAESHADVAVKMLADEPVLLTNAASIKVQLDKVDEAKKLLESALRANPKYQRAIDLQKLVKMATK